MAEAPVTAQAATSPTAHSCSSRARRCLHHLPRLTLIPSPSGSLAPPPPPPPPPPPLPRLTLIPSPSGSLAHPHPRPLPPEGEGVSLRSLPRGESPSIPSP